MDPLDLSLADLAAELDQGALSSAQLTDLYLQRIEAVDPTLGAFLCVDAAGARAAARAADERQTQGKRLSALDGVPLALKDNLLTHDLPTTAASRILEGYRAPYEATVVARLRAQGAVVLGKLNCDEFAMGSSNENSAFHPCRNPWDPTRTPGGSSGGSAASVASRCCAGTLGTDTGGSIRQPASFCGVVGLKPTYGRVSRFGVIAFASSLDQVGPLATDVRSAALLLDAISGHDPRDATSLPLPATETASALSDDVAGLRVGIPREMMESEGLAPEVAKAMADARQALLARGATVVDVSLPHTSFAVATYYIIATAEASSNLARYDGIRYGPRRGESNGLQSLYESTRGALFGPEVKRRILLGNYVLSAGYYDAYYVRAQKVRRLIADDFMRAYTQVDLLLCPTAPTPAFPLGEKVSDPLTMYLSDIFTLSVNLAGLPAVSVPAGFSTDSLPLGVQLIGPALSETRLLQAAQALESELCLQQPDLAGRRPPVIASS